MRRPPPTARNIEENRMQSYSQKPTMPERPAKRPGGWLVSARPLLLGLVAVIGMVGGARAAAPEAGAPATGTTTAPATGTTTAPATGTATAPATGTTTAPATGTTTAPATGATDAAASPEDAAASFNRELLSVEEQVDDLKERVFRSKATLQLLKEIVIEGSATGARATIWHVNRLGTAYKMESITYLLDGQSKFSKSDPSGALSESKEFKIHDGALAPGDHTLSVDFKLRPTGFGIFKYVQNYEIDVRSNYAFNIEVGKQCTVKAIVTDRGGLASSFEERAKVDYEFKCERISE